jgi:hypothetical protein
MGQWPAQRHDVDSTTSEVVGMQGPNLLCSNASDDLIFGELVDRLQRRAPPHGDQHLWMNC